MSEAEKWADRVIAANYGNVDRFDVVGDEIRFDNIRTWLVLGYEAGYRNAIWPDKVEEPVLPPIKDTQHCTNKECPFTMSHTKAFCGYEQTVHCRCGWDYPNAPWNQRR